MLSEDVLEAVLVDDERLAREELAYLLRAHPQVRVVGEADTVATAVQVLEGQRPDVVFLDVQMRGESGFDVLERVAQPMQVIFVTGYDQHAVRAFEINALDYLLKPVAPERLARAVGRLFMDEGQAQVAEGTDQLHYQDTLFLRFGHRARFVRLSDVVCIQAAGDYSEVNLLDGKTALVLRSLKAWIARLPGDHFVRVHRSAIVNLAHVRELEAAANHAYRVHVAGRDTPLTMSRRYAAQLKDRMA